MEQLIRIKTTPFKYELKINNAKFETTTTQPQHTMTRQRGGLSISHKPAELKIDSTQARESMGIKSNSKVADEFAKKGVSAAESATGRIAQEGDMMMDTRRQNVFGDIAFQRSRSSIDTMLGFIPSTPSKISFDPHQLSMKYEMDKISFDWRTSSKAETKFVPAKVEMQVKDYGKIEFEYIAGPNYVPKSADPNYKEPFGLDIKA